MKGADIREKRAGLFVSILLIMMSFTWGCERTIEEEVIRPLEAIYEQKGAASLETAVSNVRMVRAALMRYPATSPENLYPGDMEIYDYESLRKILPDENLPADMAELFWDPSYGITYLSDGYSFTLEVRALTKKREIITATPGGVTES
jgi:hypothetical protein